MHSLIVQTGKHKGKKIVLPDSEVIIGREETSFIRMTSTDVSRQHSSLTPTDKGLLVRDLGSQNGTIVNNVRIEAETLMQPGDLLQIGPILFELAGGVRPDRGARRRHLRLALGRRHRHRAAERLGHDDRQSLAARFRPAAPAGASQTEIQVDCRRSPRHHSPAPRIARREVTSPAACRSRRAGCDGGIR